MEDVSKLIVVAAALILPDRRVLLQRRPSGKSMAGLWEFPGGKVEAGERPETALIRELREELGIETDLASLQPAAFASDELGERHLLLLLYICRNWRGVPRPLHAEELKWVRTEEMSVLPMPQADAPLVDLLGALI